MNKKHNIALIARIGPEPGQHWLAATRSGIELAQSWYLRQCLWGNDANHANAARSGRPCTPARNTRKQSLLY